MADTVRKMSGHQLCILIEPFRRLRIQPAAFLMKGVGKIPVIESHIGLNTVLDQAVYEVIVISEAFLIDFSRFLPAGCGPSLRKNDRLSGPALHDGHIFFVAVILVAATSPVWCS